MEFRIKAICKEKGITIVSLAEKIGISQPSTSNIVNNKATPSLDTLEKIANVLDVPITELFEQPEGKHIICPKCGAKFRMEE